MDLLTLIIVGVVVVAVIGLYAIYAGVIKNKNAVREALSGIDVQLKNVTTLYLIF